MPANVVELVAADLAQRDAKGRQSYGAPLTSETPVNHLWMVYEEVLDMAMYIRAEIARRDEAIRALEAEAEGIERRIRDYGYGDRPSSPPAALLEVQRIIVRALDALAPLEPKKAGER